MSEPVARKAGPALTKLQHATELQPGQWVQHKTFGVGVVLQTGGNPLESEEPRALVNFDDVGKKWMVIRVARMRLLPECDWPVGQKTLSISAIQATVVLPRTEEDFKPLTDIQIKATQSRAWKESALKNRKRHQLLYRLKKGLRISPLADSLPLPWITHAALHFPPPGVIEVPGYPGRHRAGTTRGKPTVHMPRVVVASKPPYKKLRGVLYDVAQGLQYVGEVVTQDIKTKTSRVFGTKDHFFELLESAQPDTFRPGTRSFLNVMHGRAVNAIQALRAKAHANGRWWPAPESIQLVLKEDGSVVARMRFTAMYQSLKRPWIEWSKSVDARRGG